MKKVSIILVVLFFGMGLKGFSQSTDPLDFFVGKWEFTVFGTPNGDAKFATTLVREGSKLTGELSDPTDATKPKIEITSIEASADKILINFTASGYDVFLDYTKVDNNNLSGTLMNMFESKGVRIIE